MDLDLIRATDPEVAAAIGREATRQRQHLELIASENYVSPAVMAAQGSVLTNKYAEGLPGKRYYGGCEHVDEVENLAIARAKQLFGAAWANVQPHSGANANMAVQLAELKPGDVVLGMSLAHGGHLTHGSPVNVSGLWFRVVSYGLNPETELLDYDEVLRLAKQHRPKLIVAGASAYARTIDFARFRAIADEVGATLMADVAHIAGLIAAGLHPTSIGHAHVTTTTTHKTLRGPRGGLIVCDDAERGKRYDKAVFPGLQGGPLEHVIAAKAVAFHEALQPGFKAYQQQVIANAKAMGESLAAGGLRLITGGTDNHLLLVDVRPMGLTGKAADALLGEVGLTVNKNAIPNDPESPFVTSGIRVGSPAFTTRGMGEAEARRIGELIVRRLAKPNDAAEAEKVRAEVHALCEAFPVPGGAAVAAV